MVRFCAGERRVVDDRRLLAAPGIDMAVDRVEAGVADAAGEPAAVDAGVRIEHGLRAFRSSRCRPPPRPKSLAGRAASARRPRDSGSNGRPWALPRTLPNYMRGPVWQSASGEWRAATAPAGASSARHSLRFAIRDLSARLEPGGKHGVALRHRSRPQRGEFPAADAAVVPGARRRGLSGPDRDHPRQARVDLSRVLSRARGGSPRRSPSAASSAATRWRWCCPTRRRCSKRTTASPWPARCSTRINTRLDAAIIAFTLDHGEAKVLIADREFSKVVKDALGACKAKPLVIDYDDPEFSGPGERLGDLEYEDFLREGDADFAWLMPDDEWDAIALNYTSGTTGDPKGVVYHHRGAYLLAHGNVITCGMAKHPVYLWTLPMFHCNGWCFPWTLSVVAGTHVCLRAVRAAPIYDAIATHKVTHLCGAPIVMSTLLNAPDAGAQAAAPRRRVRHRRRAAAGSRAGGDEGRRLQRHPCLRPDRDLRAGERQRLAPRMGRARRPPSRRRRRRARACAIRCSKRSTCSTPKPWQPVPRDGETLGEVMFRGNVVMKGYLKNKASTDEGLRRRLVSFRRSRRHPSRRLHPAQGPLQGHHHLRRREHFLDRSRGRAVQAPGGAGGRRGRQARRQMGRDAVRLRRAKARRDARPPTN